MRTSAAAAARLTSTTFSQMRGPMRAIQPSTMLEEGAVLFLKYFTENSSEAMRDLGCLFVFRDLVKAGIKVSTEYLSPTVTRISEVILRICSFESTILKKRGGQNFST